MHGCFGHGAVIQVAVGVGAQHLTARLMVRLTEVVEAPHDLVGFLGLHQVG